MPDTTWLLKPRRSGGGLRIRFATAQDLARPPRGTYLQHHIEGAAASAVLVAAERHAVLLGATRQLLGRDYALNRPFLYVGSLGPLTLRDDEIAKLSRLGDVLAERFCLSGLFNVDFVQTEHDLWPLEVNPRYSASIEVLERVHDWNSLRLHFNACERGVLPDGPAAAKGRFAGKAVVYAGQDGRVPPALEDLAREWNQPGELPGLADLPRIGERLAAGQPVVTTIVEGESPQEVECLLRRRVASVRGLLAEAG